MELFNRILEGDIRSISRTITRIEADDPEIYPLLKELYAHTGHAQIVGLTGPPGAGKSSIINVLSQVILKRGMSVAVLAVDPSSEFTGGGVLGDRIRMSHMKNRFYFRSFGARGHLGGLSRACGNAVHLLDAAGFDLIFIETVGTGQSETEIKQYADTVIVIANPNQGDDVQTMKAGIMEIGDIFAVNKADLPGAEFTVTDLVRMTHLNAGRQLTVSQGHGVIGEVTTGDRSESASDRIPPVVKISAYSGLGMEELADEILLHREYLESNNLLKQRRDYSVRKELTSRLMSMIEIGAMAALKQTTAWEEQVKNVLDKTSDPWAAEDILMQELKRIISVGVQS